MEESEGAVVAVEEAEQVLVGLAVEPEAVSAAAEWALADLVVPEAGSVEGSAVVLEGA